MKIILELVKQVHCSDPHAYLAKTKKKKKNDAADKNPTYHDAAMMTGGGEHSAEY